MKHGMFNLMAGVAKAQFMKVLLSLKIYPTKMSCMRLGRIFRYCFFLIHVIFLLLLKLTLLLCVYTCVCVCV